MYGPRDRGLLPLFRCAARGVLPLVGRRSAGYTFVYVTDLLHAISAGVDREDDGDTVFVGHPRPVGARELLERIRAVVRPGARIVPVPAPALFLAALGGQLAGILSGRPIAINRRRYAELTAEGFVCRVDRLRDRLGVVAEVDVGEGIRRTAAWYREAGWI